MNNIKSKVFISLLFAISLISCRDSIEEEIIEDTKTPEEENLAIIFPAIIDTTELEMFLNIEDTISINFTDNFKGFGNEHLIDGKSFYPHIKLLTLDQIEIDTLWKGDSILNIWSTELLPSEQSLLLNIGWEWYDSLNLILDKEYQFTINTSEGDIPVSVIEGSYPVDRQYYFLQNEYSKSFFKLKRLPIDISQLAVTVYDSDNNLIHSSSLTKNSARNRLDFELPALANEAIYYIELKNGTQLLKRVDFRTSEYNTFQDKLITLSFLGTSRGLHIAWEQHYLIQYADIISEGFDQAETSTGVEAVEGTNYEYCNGLIVLEFNTEGNSWYNDFLYPMVYEPFPDPNFDPQFPVHPNLGKELTYAMKIHFWGDEDFPYLLDSEINSGIGSQTSPSIVGFMNYVQSAAAYDFYKMQQSVVDAYINNDNNPERINRVITGRYSILTRGIYKYNMNYTLPDGTVSSTRTYEMNW